MILGIILRDSFFAIWRRDFYELDCVLRSFHQFDPAECAIDSRSGYREQLRKIADGIFSADRKVITLAKPDSTWVRRISSGL